MSYTLQTTRSWLTELPQNRYFILSPTLPKRNVPGIYSGHHGTSYWTSKVPTHSNGYHRHHSKISRPSGNPTKPLRNTAYGTYPLYRKRNLSSAYNHSVNSAGATLCPMTACIYQETIPCNFELARECTLQKGWVFSAIRQATKHPYYR